MTTHFSNGVTNVRGKDGASSVFSGIKQPLITGGYEQEQAYQNDFSIYNASDWAVTSTGGSDFQLAQYAGGWLRQGDNAPAAGEIQGVAGPEVWQYLSTNKWWFETSIAVTDVSDANIYVGFAQDGYVDSDTLPTDGIGFSHLQDTTTIQFKLYLNGNLVGVQAATTVPDDIALEMNMMIAHKGTNANHLVVDYFNTFQSRVAASGVSA
jgi:hypothetical protein